MVYLRAPDPPVHLLVLYPMALAFTRHLQLAVVYDCMDELSAFKGASALRDHEAELFRHADLGITGGQSLYEKLPAPERLRISQQCGRGALKSEEHHTDSS